MPATLLIDAHVHLHPGDDPGACLDAAAANLARARDALQLTGEVTGVLMLTEMAGVNRFAELAAGGPCGTWRIDRTGEAASLTARRDGAVPLLLVAGRQAATAERLEVLALGTDSPLPDRASLHATLNAARATGGLAVLPYGVGKWTGARGQMVRQIIERDGDDTPLLGDNANRMAGLPTPALLRDAATRGLPVLPGSDPLPLPGQLQRIGSYGLVIEHDLDPAVPARQLTAMLAGLARPPRRFGRLTSPWAFARTQLAMRMNKRR